MLEPKSRLKPVPRPKVLDEIKVYRYMARYGAPLPTFCPVCGTRMGWVPCKVTSPRHQYCVETGFRFVYEHWGCPRKVFWFPGFLKMWTSHWWRFCTFVAEIRRLEKIP